MRLSNEAFAMLNKKSRNVPLIPYSSSPSFIYTAPIFKIKRVSFHSAISPLVPFPHFYSFFCLYIPPNSFNRSNWFQKIWQNRSVDSLGFSLLYVVRTWCHNHQPSKLCPLLFNLLFPLSAHFAICCATTLFYFITTFYFSKRNATFHTFLTLVSQR